MEDVFWHAVIAEVEAYGSHVSVRVLDTPLFECEQEKDKELDLGGPKITRQSVIIVVSVSPFGEEIFPLLYKVFRSFGALAMWVVRKARVH